MIATVVAMPIFSTRQQKGLPNGAEIIFEVFRIDAGGLSVGDTKYYSVDGGKPFWSRVKSQESCESTHPALSLLRDKPTLRCVLEVSSEETQDRGPDEV